MAKSFGRYEILERLSKGGMAEVFKGRSTGAAGFEKVVAIKRILPSLSTDPMFVSMFIEEAKLSANLNHVNIAQIYEFGELDGQYFIAMEYVHGKDLRALQRHFRQSGASMPVPMALRIATDICSALDYAHNRKDATGRQLQIVHRDISPPNVLISFEGSVKLIDFGIAKALTRSRSTATGMLKGKLGYLSPEQAEGRELDGRSDLFALGTVLWELLTGVRLFHEATDMATLMKVRRAEVSPPSDLNPDIPAALDAIVLKALAREADERFQRADLFYEALEKVARQPGLSFTPIQLARFMSSTFAPTRDEQTAVATPSPSPLRVEVLAPEPALDAPPPKPAPSRPAMPRPPLRPEPSRPKIPEILATGPQPVLRPDDLPSVAGKTEADADPATRVSEESAQLAKKLTSPARALEDRTGPTRMPAQRPRTDPSRRGGADARPAVQTTPRPEPVRESTPRPTPRPEPIRDVPSAPPTPRPEPGRRRPDAVRGARPVLPGATPAPEAPGRGGAAKPEERTPAPGPRRGGAAKPEERTAAPVARGPARRATSGAGRAADAWGEETKDLRQGRPPAKEPALPATPTPAIPPALTLQGGWDALEQAHPPVGDDWEDGPTTLKEEPAARALAAPLPTIDPEQVIALDEREAPKRDTKAGSPEEHPLSERKSASAERAPLDLGQMIESSIGDGAGGPLADWPEPMESPELEVSAAPPAAPTPAPPPPRPAPTPAPPPPRPAPTVGEAAPSQWDDGPTRFEPEGSPAMAAELGAEHAQDEADRMVLAPEVEAEESAPVGVEALPIPGRPIQARAPRWPWLLLGVAVLALIAAVLVLVLR